VNIRPATHEDDAFLREMLYEAAAWNPDWPRERLIAELDREPVGSAWYRLFTAEEPGYGFVDEKTPELGLAVVPLHRRKGIGHTLLRALMVQAREDGFQALSLSVAVHNRSRMMYERAGFERVREEAEGESWVMRAELG
jgi:ribosomal protein S18 acetylase RimI-like enzyme